MNIFYYDSAANLYCEDVKLSDLCNRFPTPFYVYSAADIRQNCSDVIKCSKSYDVMPCYALKANYNPAILNITKEMGLGVDVVSGGELYFALKRGVSAEKIVFAGVGKTAEEIEYAIGSNIHSLNIESESELHIVSKIADRLKKKIRIAIRVNPDINPQTHPYISTGLELNKFGVPRDQAIKLYKDSQNMDWVSAEGIHVHIGSQITSAEPFLETATFLENLVTELSGMGIHISFLDLGGGIGINYENQLDDNSNERTYIKSILPAVLDQLAKLNLKLFVELGRSIVGSAGLLLTKVLHIKETHKKKFIIVDAAMNNLIRPSLYQAHHQILPLVQTKENLTEKVDVVGPVCETGDFLAKDRELPRVKQDNYLAITAAGAYGQSLSSNYNLRPHIAEILVDGNNYTVIKERESIEDIAGKYVWE